VRASSAGSETDRRRACLSVRALVLLDSRTLTSQIEYLVASVAEDEHAVRLSLRQSEILDKLQSVVLDPELEKLKPAGW
jgi:hypothetical protein